MASGASTVDFEGLYSRHADWLSNWLRGYTRCSDKALDLMQDTFCKLIESRVAEAPRNPRPYLATVARRLLIDNARRAEVERTFLEAHAAVMAGVSVPCPERIASAIDELNAVLRELDKLPERARRGFLMARLDGLTYAEVAARLGVSKDSVKQYVAKGYACCYAAAYGAEPGIA